LNIDVQDSDATAKLAAWFEERWEDRFSLDITAEIIDLIANSWADEDQPTPFEVYLKVCHSLSQDARDGMGYVLPKSMSDLLLDYQESAVRTLSRRIVRRGGTMLGDVVGLGKTLTAVATALMLQAAEDYSTLVLCPKNLQPMWEKHIEEYDINGRVVPYSMADKVAARAQTVQPGHLRRVAQPPEQLHHRLRRDPPVHPDQRLQGPAAHRDPVQPGVHRRREPDRPVHRRGRGPGHRPDRGAAQRPQPDGQGRRKDQHPHRVPQVRGTGGLERLMSDHLVRRTRSFIKRTAKKELVAGPDGTTTEREYLQFANGQKFHFPTRVSTPVSHQFAADDPAALMEDETTLDAVRDLLLPRYRLADYDNPKARTPRKTPRTWTTSARAGATSAAS
jgi:hypothetical protein